MIDKFIIIPVSSDFSIKKIKKGDSGGPLIGHGLRGDDEAILLGVVSLAQAPCYIEYANICMSIVVQKLLHKL